MIEFKKGDMFTSKADVLVCPVNCVGVMGAGLAKEFKKRHYDTFFEHYQKLCLDTLRPGILKIHSYYIPSKDDIRKMLHKGVLLFPTKFDWKDNSRIEYIEQGLKYFQIGTLFFKYAEDNQFKSYAFPKLGCGCGGLNWKDVKPLMLKYLDSEYSRKLGITIEIWE